MRLCHSGFFALIELQESSVNPKLKLMMMERGEANFREAWQRVAGLEERKKIRQFGQLFRQLYKAKLNISSTERDQDLHEVDMIDEFR